MDTVVTLVPEEVLEEIIVSVDEVSVVTETTVAGVECDIVTETSEVLEMVAEQIQDHLTETEYEIEVITEIGVGPQGPAGPSSSEEEAVYAKRVDFVSDDLLYRGEAAVGSLPSDAAWRIRRIAFNPVDGDVVETWAGGNANFDKVWDDHTSLVYV